MSIQAILYTMVLNSFQPGRAPHIIIVTTVLGWDLNPGPLSLEESAHLV